MAITNNPLAVHSRPEQAQLAARIARAGFPVFRFDRRGVGDSEGENRGFRHSAKDIAAALDSFRAIAPQVSRVVAFGNCDAASALMLAGGAGLAGLVLSNPWTIEQEAGGEDSDTAPPPRRDPRALSRKSSPTRARSPDCCAAAWTCASWRAGWSARSARPPAPTSLAGEMRAGLVDYAGDVRILLATADRTAQVFEAAWDRNDPRIRRCEGAGHAYVEPEHAAWLESQIPLGLARLALEQAHQFDMG